MKEFGIILHAIVILRSYLNDQRSARKTMALSDMVSVAGGRGFKVPPLVGKLLLPLLFMAVSATAQLASVPQVCRIPDNSVTLTSPGTVFVRTEDETLRIVMKNPKCGSFVAQNVNLNEMVASNLTSGNGYQVSPWYELNLISNSEEHLVKIGSRVIERFPKKNSQSACDMNEIEFFFQRTSILGRSCKEMNHTLPIDISFFDIDLSSASVDDQPPGENRPHPSSFPIGKNNSIIDALGVLNDLIAKYLRRPQSNSNFANDQLSSERFGNPEDQNFVNWPDAPSVKYPSDDTHGHSTGLPTFPPSISEDSNSFDPGYPYRNDREESVIPIFIGVIAFVVSMCIRFCLCRRKRVVTTVAVIRSIPSSELEASDAPTRHHEHLDLPPAYADILNETSQDCPPDSYMDLPPAYDDIRDDTTPPPYSEIEAQSLPPSNRTTEAQPSTTSGDIESTGELGPEEETAAGDGNTEPVSPAPAGPDPSATRGSSSSLARVLTSQFRSLRTQFAFKPLQEE